MKSNSLLGTPKEYSETHFSFYDGRQSTKLLIYSSLANPFPGVNGYSPLVPLSCHSHY